MFNLFSRRKKCCMESEILVQSKILQGLIDAYVSENNCINIDVPENINRIILVASGSSYHCARYAADILGSIAKIEARAVYSSEFLLEDTIAHNDELLYVFIKHPARCKNLAGCSTVKIYVRPQGRSPCGDVSYVVIICPCLGISFSASAGSSVSPLPEAV